MRRDRGHHRTGAVVKKGADLYANGKLVGTDAHLFIEHTLPYRERSYREWLKRLGQPDLVITEDGTMFYTREGTGQIIDKRV
jgi:hypothetical protein